MLEAVTAALTTVISWVGSVITALTSTTGALAPLLPIFAIGIAVSALTLGKSALCRVKIDGKTWKAETLIRTEVFA